MYVGQANEGLFSHNFNNVDQIYAYDFSLDMNDEILAARPGTVVAFVESIPDDTSPGGNWNYIAIRHDIDDSGAAIPPDAQDQGPGGGQITHGRRLRSRPDRQRQRGLRAGTRPPVPTANIVGTPVKQGMPIMDAGYTGISFHNHLHMHVVPDPVGGGGTGNTIPFVFSDPDAGDGVPDALQLLHVGEREENVVSATAPAVRKPAFSLSFGSGSTDDWARSLATVSVEAGLAPAVDVAEVVFSSRDDAPKVALGDTGDVSLGFDDDGPVAVFKGAVRAVHHTVVGNDAARRLERRRRPGRVPGRPGLRAAERRRHRP